jgi:hypothetical protein
LRNPGKRHSRTGKEEQPKRADEQQKTRRGGFFVATVA